MDLVPDVNSFIVYGVPVALIVAFIVEALVKWTMLSETTINLIRAGLFTASYFLVTFLPEIEKVCPDLQRYLPVMMVAFLIFCSQAGLKPIAFTQRVKGFLSKGK